MHGVQGCFASHLCSLSRRNKTCGSAAQGGESLTRFLFLARRRHGRMSISGRSIVEPFRDPHRHCWHASPILKVFPVPLFFTDMYKHSSILNSVHRKQRGVAGIHFYDVNFNRQPRWPESDGKHGDDLPLYESWMEAIVCVSASNPGPGRGWTALFELTYMPNTLFWPSSLREEMHICEGGIWCGTRAKDPDFLALAVLNGSYRKWVNKLVLARHRIRLGTRVHSCDDDGWTPSAPAPSS